MVNFNQTESALSLAQIEEVERFVGLNFPAEYKAHLLKYNGGRCSPNAFKFNECGKISESCVDWFLAIHEGDYDSLTKEIEMVKIEEKRMPSHILPIAHDPGGNLICISCGISDYGKIYFWDHENEVNYETSNDDDYSNLFLISETLDEFLNSLFYFENV